MSNLAAAMYQSKRARTLHKGSSGLADSINRYSCPGYMRRNGCYAHIDTLTPTPSRKLPRNLSGTCTLESRLVLQQVANRREMHQRGVVRVSTVLHAAHQPITSASEGR